MPPVGFKHVSLLQSPGRNSIGFEGIVPGKNDATTETLYGDARTDYFLANDSRLRHNFKNVTRNLKKMRTGALQ